MARAGDAVDETIAIGGNAGDAARRVLQIIESARSHQVIVESTTTYRLIRRYRPAWAVPLIFVKTVEECAMAVAPDRRGANGGVAIRLVGRLPRTTLAAVRLVLETPPQIPSQLPPHAAYTVGRVAPPPAYAPVPPAAAAFVTTPPAPPAPPTPPFVPTQHTPVHATTLSDHPAAGSVPAYGASTPGAPIHGGQTYGEPSYGTPAPAGPRDDALNGTMPARHSRVAAAHRRTPCSIVFDTGDEVRVDGLVVVGRDPAYGPGESGRLMPINDPDFSISKTHLALGADADGVWVMDRHSLNGTVIARSGGDVLCPAGERVYVRPGESVFFGQRSFTVRAVPADVT